MYPWFWNIRFPFSGDLTQEIAPETSWDLPFSGPYQGNRPLERRILAEGAGYGEQLGVILAAVEELIVQAKAQNKPAAKKLLALKKKIETVKTQHYATATTRAREALAALQQEDKKAYDALLAEVTSSKL